MKRILKLMLKQRTGPIKLRLLPVCLMGLVFLSCAGIPQFPTKYIYEVDIKNQACGRYVITDYEKLLFSHNKDLPLAECDGTFGFSRVDISPVLNWARDRITDAKNKCGR